MKIGVLQDNYSVVSQVKLNESLWANFLKQQENL